MSTPAPDNKAGVELYCTACERTFIETLTHCPHDQTRLLRLTSRVDPLLGRDLDGRFTILEKLGEGGMGSVYRAQQRSIDREVAVKVVHAAHITNSEVIKRFLREAKLASKLSHPNAVGVLDFGQTEDGIFYLVMELVAGRTLEAVFKSEGKLAPERVVRIGIQICDALEAAQALSIIHRDLKPANIMMLAGTRDAVKVLDFGLAKSTAPDQTSTTMTGTGAVIGTPMFMPPELARGRPCDARSDLYSLGAILYLLGSGSPPFLSESIHELVAMHASWDPVPPMTGVPIALAEVIDKLLRKEPDDRYASAAAARDALEIALVHRTSKPSVFDTNPSVGPFPMTASMIDERTLPVIATAPTFVGPIPRPNTDTFEATPAPRRSRKPLAIAIVLLSLVAGAVGVVIAQRQKSDEPVPAAPIADEQPAPPPPRVEPPPPKAEPPPQKIEQPLVTPPVKTTKPPPKIVKPPPKIVKPPPKKIIPPTGSNKPQLPF